MANAPKQILNDIFWAFDGTEFQSQDEFRSALEEYANDLEVALPPESTIEFGKIEILLEYITEDDDDEELQFMLNADNGKSFTSVELLYKINIEVTGILADLDKHFFEGLTLLEDRNPPLYSLNLGS